jgi:hypothetical protein
VTSLELNFKAAQWTCGAVWNRWYMDAKPGKDMRQMWKNHETEITKKVTNAQAVTENDLRRAATAAASQPAARLPESTFLHALGTPNIRNAPPQTESLALRAMEEWERGLCENQAFAILPRMQTGRSALIKKDGGEMLVAMALDRPLAEAQALVRDPPKLIQEILLIMEDKQSHPVIEGMVKADVRDDLPTSEFALASSASSSTRPIRLTQTPTQPKEQPGKYQ